MAASRNGKRAVVMRDRPQMGIVLLALVVLIAGCKTLAPAPADGPGHQRAGDVAVDMLLPPSGAVHMELSKSQRFLFPAQLEPVAMPSYPLRLLALRLDPVRVCVEIDIGIDGGVAEARRSPDTQCDSGPLRDEFVQASLGAARQWNFTPAMLCKAPDNSAADPCLHPRMTQSPTAVRLSYAFRFSQRDGKPTVEQVAGEE